MKTSDVTVIVIFLIYFHIIMSSLVIFVHLYGLEKDLKPCIVSYYFYFQFFVVL